ncbi:MAG: hypothetical protein AABZ33_06235 [Chloroflexota bacterium]
MDEFDQRLRDAGQAWRDGQAEQPPLETIIAGLHSTPGPNRPGFRQFVVLSAAAGLVAVLGLTLGPILLPPQTGPGASPEPVALYFVNVDGPDVSILIADRVVADVPCGASTTLAAGGDLPPLPWSVVVRASDGEVIGSPEIVGPLPRSLLIRGRHVLTGGWPIKIGGAPSPLDQPCGSGAPASPVSTPAASPSPRPTDGETVSAETVDGRFRLVLELPKTVWTTEESISGEARLEYAGPAATRLHGSGSGLISFGAREGLGTRWLTPGWDTTCAAYEISRDRPQVSPLTKSGAWGADDPNADFYREFFADPLYRLPAGEWYITAYASFSEGDCGVPAHELEMTIRIRVVAPVTEADGAIRLWPAPADLGCDAIPAPYRSFTIRIDPTAVDQVWAITDGGVRLWTSWAPGFRGGSAGDPVIRDPAGEVVARDGELVALPDGDWPRLHGYFVCPSPDAIYVLRATPG